MDKLAINEKIASYELMLEYLKTSQLQGSDYDNEYHRIMTEISVLEERLGVK